MFVVTLPPSAEKHPKAFTQKAKRAGADILEIRSDLTPDVRSFDSPLPILLSLRSQTRVETSSRQKKDQLTHGSRYLLHGSRYLPADDSEKAGGTIFQNKKLSFLDQDVQLPPCTIPKRVRLILSFHDYEKTPSLVSLKKIVQKMYSSKPWMIKIATMIRSYDDLLVLHDLQEFMNKKSIRSTVLGMGPKAHLTRVLSPLHNTFTYASLDPENASAEGQLPLSFYQLTKNRKNPRLFGILGGPHITASLSPVVHNTLFKRHRIDALYSCFPTEDFGVTMKSLEELGIQGLSVTAPFKREAFDYAAAHDPISQKLGVANTLVKKRGVWHAYNTDVFGVLHGYPALKRAKKIAILGAGGAVPAIIKAIRMASSRAEVTVFARDKRKAKQCISSVETQNLSSLQVRDLSEASQFQADIIICAVSEDVNLPLPKPTSSKALAIDLRYGKVTKFMKAAKQKKFRVKNGMSMLKKQAARQSKLFCTVKHRNRFKESL